MTLSPARPDELGSAAIRALSGTPGVRLRGGVLHDGTRTLPVTAPHLRPGHADSHRGAADGMALRLRHSDLALHHELRPAAALPGLVFDLLEQLRTEALGARRYPGVRANLRHRFLRWSREFADARLTETDTGLLLYTVAQVGRSTLFGEPIADDASEIIEATRFTLASRIGHALRGLRRDRDDQRAYARSALAIATVIGELATNAEESDTVTGRATAGMARLFGLDDSDDDGSGAADPTSGHVGAAPEYRVFTTAYDVEEAASAVARPALLADYRRRVDDRLATAGIALAPMVRQLRGLLAGTGTATAWERGHEAGTVDPAQLTRLVTTTGARDVFRAETEQPDVSCVVTLLIDCSGSMRRHAEDIAMLADVLARALEHAGASCEILGFTTRGWHGGRAVADWRRAGKPARPGRLTDLRHLVFKDAETTYRRARRDVAALLKPDLYREGVAGEALRWARRRVLARPERHHVVLFVSDGTPMDTATAHANGSRYLDDHLGDVVLRIEAAGDLAVAGIGTNADLSRYFRHAHELDVTDGMSNALLRQVLHTLAETRA